MSLITLGFHSWHCPTCGHRIPSGQNHICEGTWQDHIRDDVTMVQDEDDQRLDRIYERLDEVRRDVDNISGKIDDYTLMLQRLLEWAREEPDNPVSIAISRAIRQTEKDK